MACTCRPSAECPEHLGILVPCPPADDPDAPPVCETVEGHLVPRTNETGSEDLAGAMFAPAEWDGGFLGQWFEDLKAEALLAEVFEQVEDDGGRER